MEPDEKACPFCAETIKVAALKCKHCGEMLEGAQQPLTEIVSERWDSIVVLRSNGSPKQFLDAISGAIESVGLPIVDRSYENQTLTFESKGISAKSWSGDTTSVVVTACDGGSRASFTSKGKPSGMLRLQSKVKATKWVERLVPGFGPLWKAQAR